MKEIFFASIREIQFIFSLHSIREPARAIPNYLSPLSYDKFQKGFRLFLSSSVGRKAMRMEGDVDGDRNR